MKVSFIKELSYYSQEELANHLKIDLETAARCIKTLTARGVLKFKTNNANEYDDAADKGVCGKYQFVYVGIIVFNNLILMIYPKYMNKQPDVAEIQQILKVIRKTSGSFAEITAITEDGIKSNDRLALMLSIIEMYSDYGIYTNFEKRFATNGTGTIAWDRTITKYNPLFSNGIPVYVNYETTETAEDQSDFIKRLHASILSTITEKLEKYGLLELLAIDPIELTDEHPEDIADKSYLEYRLDRELNVQFITWKQDLIQLLKRFIVDDEMFIRSDEIICLGTTTFYHVWECACKVAFSDKIDNQIGSLGIQLSERWTRRAKETLFSIIPRPQWYRWNDSEYETCNDVSTLIPDIITFWTSKKAGNVFAIIDAKYYVPHLGAKVRGIPGVESITKQYLYQKAYTRFVLDHDFNTVVNAFVVPTTSDEIKLLGKAEFPDIFEKEEAPFMDCILMWALPAKTMWDCYLQDKGFDEIKCLSNWR